MTPIYTRDEAIRDYFDKTAGATSAVQAMRFEQLCNRLEHVGWMRGYEQCSTDTNKVLDKVLPNRQAFVPTLVPHGP